MGMQYNQKLCITEEDGSPDTYPWQVRFSNGDVTDNGDGTISVDTNPAGGGASNTEPFVTIGNTAGLTAERALTGTVNQVVVTDNGANSTVVLSTPQDIHTGANPTFETLNLNATTNQIVLDADAANTGTLSMLTLTADRTWDFPDKSGTVALLSDITGSAASDRHLIMSLMGS